MERKRILIIGAGLAGSLLAISLGRKGFEVDVIESRPDMRKTTISAGRSINLALSNRGIAALREVGLDSFMLSEAVPMTGRMIHALDGSTRVLPYSGREGEYINSISRGGLNIALMNLAESLPNVRLHFGISCTSFNCETGEIKLSDGKSVDDAVVFGTDGAGSVIRNAMLGGGVARFDFSQTWLSHGYKELHIWPTGEGNGFAIEKNLLHIWPRDKFLMIALPNLDGSFTCTLFLAHAGDNSFSEVAGDVTAQSEISDENIERFFEKNFADVIELIPDLCESYRANPVGNLGTIKCYPWNVGGKALLLGDAAHAIVPFYGQGMNASFEDCRILSSLIEGTDVDWEKVFTEFTEIRKKNADAIADLAVENFYEMRDAVADPVFVKKRALETKLEQTFPDYFSKYSLVTFRDDVPYSHARSLGNAQDRLLMSICANNDDVEALDLAEIRRLLAELPEANRL
jgi:kynurenine 3-monooxygenase